MSSGLAGRTSAARLGRERRLRSESGNRMSTAVLSIGSNLGDRLAHLQGAVDSVRDWLVAVSPVYETAPWGPVDQDDYLNAIVIAHDDAATPTDWLQRAHAAEAAADRSREVRWGPRTLDVDIVAVDDVRTDDPALLLPHPRAHERAFVLVPWLAVAPDATLGSRVADLVAALPADEVAAVRLRPDLVIA
jgi:2-amino-4-hydroxy-6-hydroxymethyldihydropteridine diphosphokinase